MGIHLSQAQIEAALPRVEEGLRRYLCSKRESPTRMTATAIPSFAAASTGSTAFGAVWRGRTRSTA